MNEINFKKLEDIGNFKIRFKCFDDPDGYRATFHIYDKDSEKIHYQINFKISGTQYNTTEEGNIKSNKDLINEKYGNLEKCFNDVGYGYLVKAISTGELKTETISLINYLSL